MIELNNFNDVVHSDIHLENFMFNEKKKSVALTDFDSAKIEGMESNPYMRMIIVNRYLMSNNYEKHVDTFTFNLLTFALLIDKPIEDAYLYLDNHKYTNIFTSPSAIKTLEDISNYRRNDNYLIDMIDDSKILK